MQILFFGFNHTPNPPQKTNKNQPRTCGPHPPNGIVSTNARILAPSTVAPLAWLTRAHTPQHHRGNRGVAHPHRSKKEP